MTADRCPCALKSRGQACSAQTLADSMRQGELGGALTPPLALVRVALGRELVLRVLAALQPLPLLRLQEVRPGRLRRQHKLHAPAHVSMACSDVTMGSEEHPNMEAHI